MYRLHGACDAPAMIDWGARPDEVANEPARLRHPSPSASGGRTAPEIVTLSLSILRRRRLPWRPVHPAKTAPPKPRSLQRSCRRPYWNAALERLSTPQGKSSLLLQLGLDRRFVPASSVGSGLDSRRSPRHFGVAGLRR